MHKPWWKLPISKLQSCYSIARRLLEMHKTSMQQNGRIFHKPVFHPKFWKIQPALRWLSIKTMLESDRSKPGRMWKWLWRWNRKSRQTLRRNRMRVRIFLKAIRRWHQKWQSVWIWWEDKLYSSQIGRPIKIRPRILFLMMLCS